MVYALISYLLPSTPHFLSTSPQSTYSQPTVINYLEELNASERVPSRFDAVNCLISLSLSSSTPSNSDRTPVENGSSKSCGRF